MLYVTGTINGVSYNEAPVDPNLIIKELGITPLENTMEFRITPERKKIDAFGQVHVPLTTRIATNTDVNIQNGSIKASFTLRYATNRSALAGGGYEYSPTRLTDFAGEALCFAPDDDIEKYLFFFLHKANENGPNYRPNVTPLYRIYNRQQETQAANDLLKLINKTQQDIFTMDETALRIRANGLGYNSQKAGQVNIDRSMDVETLRNTLSQILTRDGMEFIYAWEDKAQALRGLIRVAVDRGVIVLRNNAAGGQVYAWDGGIDICTVGRGEDPETKLFTEFSYRYTELMPILGDKMNMQQREAVALPDIEPVEVLTKEAATSVQLYRTKIPDLVAYAVNSGCLEYSRATGFVTLINVDGDVAEPELFQATPATWRTELIDALKKPAAADIKKKIVEAIIAATKQ